MPRLPVWSFLPAFAAAALAADQAGVKGPGEDPPPITIYTHFEQPYSSVSVDAMKEELEAIVHPAGISLEWRSLDAARGRESAVELVVVTFKGRCRMDELAPFASAPGALGSTHVSDGAVLPFADVYCDRIRRLIGEPLEAEDVRTRQNMLGRAMGRVLAHELYHVVARSTAHVPGGITKAFYTAGDLLRRKAGFSKKEAATLRNLKLRSLASAVGSGALPAGAR